MRSKRWRVKPLQPERAKEMGRALGISPVTAQCLINRGVDTPDAAQRFLTHDPSVLHDPFLMRDMDQAAQRLATAVRQKERVLIYGDYDVDGTSASAFLARLLSKLGVDVSHFVPHREEDGYGLHNSGIDAAAQLGATLLVTVDCGVSGVKEVAHARSQGLDVIITDHHEPGPELPAAVAVLNPKRVDCSYPFRELCGAGVAFKLACALGTLLGFQYKHLAGHFLDLIALGTICDVVPLVGENRFLAKEGLRLLPYTKKLGLRALLEKARLTGRELNSHDVGFIIGPRLNASGRLGTARDAFTLLVTSDPHEADQLAQQLTQMNRERQEEESRTLAEAVQIIQETVDLRHERALVVASPGWRSGVVGIVASRLVERYHRPTFVIAISDDEARGSGRSIASFHLFRALERCQDVLIRCGGHEQAAGLSVEPGRIDEFRQRLNEVAGEMLTEEDMIPTLELDADLKPAALTARLTEELEELAPFGQGNPRPLFCCRDLTVEERRRMGNENQHLRLAVSDGNRRFPCVGWRMGDLYDELREGERVAVCFTPEMNEWQGQREMRWTLKDIKKMREA
jgi:single-stranded-DNA-specific exonuclease